MSSFEKPWNICVNSVLTYNTPESASSKVEVEMPQGSICSVCVWPYNSGFNYTFMAVPRLYEAYIVCS